MSVMSQYMQERERWRDRHVAVVQRHRNHHAAFLLRYWPLFVTIGMCLVFRSEIAGLLQQVQAALGALR